PTALAIQPGTGQLWAVVNERDEIGGDLVPDYLTAVQEGAFYGWPYSYWGQNVDDRVRPQDPDKVAAAVKPDYALGAHVAALGVAFSNQAMGGQFTDGVFVGEHGSWNRSEPVGYKVVLVPFQDGRPSGTPIDFVAGFRDSDGTTRGRPVGVTVDPQGALIVADDLSNTIWRVTPTERPTAASARHAAAARVQLAPALRCAVIGLLSALGAIPPLAGPRAAPAPGAAPLLEPVVGPTIPYPPPRRRR